MNKKLLIAVIVAAVMLPIGTYAVSPLFINTTIDEPLPPSVKNEKTLATGAMLKDGSETMMKKVDQVMEKKEAMFLSGSFVGAGDGIHNAEGISKVISLEDGTSILRFENFKSTNGPDLYVYLATDDGATDFINLERLKANNGNQNYNIPDGADLSKYDTVLIWCKQFSVLFGSAELKLQ
ncbi:MAG: DM13 domain-containing protein [Nitrososphaerota archaeon]